MNRDEAWHQVARECPRRIIEELHSCGEYHHGTSSRYPGKVLCCHRDSPLPAGWQPTLAQVHAEALPEEAAEALAIAAV